MIIPNYSAYDIDTRGVVTNIKTGEVIKRRAEKYDYVYIKNDRGHMDRAYVHQLLAATYLKKPRYDCVVSFKDSNPDNLELSNIEYISRSDLALRCHNPNQRRRSSRCDTPEARQLIVDVLSNIDYPVKMTGLAEHLGLPYSVVRYSMYHLIDDGIVEKTARGYKIK